MAYHRLHFHQMWHYLTFCGNVMEWKYRNAIFLTMLTHLDVIGYWLTLKTAVGILLFPIWQFCILKLLSVKCFRLGNWTIWRKDFKLNGSWNNENFFIYYRILKVGVSFANENLNDNFSNAFDTLQFMKGKW